MKRILNQNLLVFGVLSIFSVSAIAGSGDLVSPVMTNEKPAAGKRVRRVAPEYKGTDVYHSLYLPVDWKPSGKYPVIVEYTGNKAPFCNSTGQVKDANLGYGISGGRGFIWVSMPYVEKGRKKNAVKWWGDRQATVDYCKVNLPRICKEFGGDPKNVFICGFSRGAIGASYIGLADDEIASLWKGMFTHDHFDGQRKWGYPESDRKSALKRLARLKGRPVLVCGAEADYLKDHLGLARFTFLDVPVAKIFKIPEGKVIHPHTDMWIHRQSKYRKQARAWLQKVLLALDYPGIAPGMAKRLVGDDRAVLQNAVIRGEWKLDGGRVSSLTIESKQNGQSVKIVSGYMPSIALSSGRRIDLVSPQPVKPVRLENNSIVADFLDKESGLKMRWSAKLSDGDNAIIQTLQLTASKDTKIKDLRFVNATLDGAQQVGQVNGSVIVFGDVFMAIEHPLAINTVGKRSNVSCILERGNVLKAGQSWTYTSVIGVVPPGQLRRGFLYYLERRRAHPYRPFLHYNNWYDVILARRTERIRESECLEAIEIYGRQLVEKRKVKIDAFVWDDGWDDFNSLWDFHKGFPEGFKNLNAAAGKYGAAQGVWMSPWGGYASAKNKRIAYGKSKGYETNAGGYSMAGPKYRKAFADVCLKMIRENGVAFFKFDGMGGGNKATGAQLELADDIDAVLELTRTLRREKPDIFISATVGTWASPFWTLYADSIWRQGGDNGLFGKGDTRQQWITYRDKFCYERIVQLGPLYPLNSLMLHGILIGDRRSPARIVRNEKSVADEIWTFFGSGTNLQEMYINPKLPTERMWDELATAAKWSRANSDVLVDTHWIGGDPAKGQVYGWASWRPGKGIIVLRNPSDKPQQFDVTPKTALELPDGVDTRMSVSTIYPGSRKHVVWTMATAQRTIQHLKPFEVIVMELRKIE